MHKILATFSGVSCTCGYMVHTGTYSDALVLGEKHANENEGNATIRLRPFGVVEEETDPTTGERRMIRHNVFDQKDVDDGA